MIDGAYADGTPGWSGSDTSREAAQHPRVASTQDRVLNLVHLRGYYGITQQEVSAALNVGHGSASGALTRLHKSNHIVRTTTRRNRQQVYFAPEYATGHTLSPYRPQTGTKPTVPVSEIEETVRCINFIPGNADNAIRFLLTNCGIQVDEER